MSGATQNKDGTKKRWIHGRAVQDGKLRFLSVSSLEKGDSSKPTGCLRRWHYQYIGGIKEPPSDKMEAGERMHAEIAHYLRTGENHLSRQVIAGMHMIPERVSQYGPLISILTPDPVTCSILTVSCFGMVSFSLELAIVPLPAFGKQSYNFS